VDILARDNYSYQKYRREQAKKKKKEEKLQRKLEKKNAQAAGDPVVDPGQVTTEDTAAQTTDAA
jgi:hypothetical protein